MKQDYYLGLDIGTNSVGWAVTDESYQLCKFKRKAMWGIRLFDQAELADVRRLSRSNRRRISRKKERIDLLQEIFAEEMEKKDPTFFQRLNESRLHLEDKTVHERFPLFVDSDYNDIHYYDEYPTIFHLRKELIEHGEEHDIRLVYLAIHNIIKYRGHFLIDGDLEAARDFHTTFDQMLRGLSDELEMPLEMTAEKQQEFESILRNKREAKSNRAKALAGLFTLERAELEDEEYKRRKSVIDQVCKLLVGNKGDLSKLFDVDKEELTKSSVSFAETSYEETRLNLDSEIPEQSHIIDLIKSVYDWSILVDILQGETHISVAKVNQYQKHKENLSQLRRLVLTYCDKETYNAFFNDENGKNNYAAYIGMVKKNGKKYNVKKTAEEDFYKELTKMLEGMEPEEADRELWQTLLEESKSQTLLPLQRNKDNGAVPRQVNEEELKQILEQASVYLPFLNERDESGLSNRDKILSLFRHRIPYYVGPLSLRHQRQGANVWAVRREGEEYTRIYPWNMRDVIDYEKSNEAFINRMTNKCTYLIGEDVLPKNSLLYEKYMVLNELNNLKVYGKKVPEKTKQEIYRDLFMTKARVTGKALQQYLRKEIPDLTVQDLSGFDQDFKASLRSYLDFKKQVFGEDIEKPEIQEMVEDIIRWITIYGDDKKMLRNMIEKVYPGKLTKEQYKKINTLRYSGWGNFSRKFLTGIDGENRDTRQVFTIMEALWDTNDNLMQLLSGQYTFTKEIEAYNQDLRGEVQEISYDALVKDLYTSPANKRAIWQTIQIAEEVKQVMGCPPKRIFVEMARGEVGGKKKKTRTQSRKDRLLELYAGCKEDERDWSEELKSHDEREFNSLKLYLYYTQMGRCMYTGEHIDLEELMSANSRWDRDHIYPQSKIKDDSLDNLVLVKKTVNAKKTNEMLSADIQRNMKKFWKGLLTQGLISKTKYDRLTRTGEFTDEELAGFISRQLVETRQSSKLVAELFKSIYPETSIVYVKAGRVSDFRQDPLDCLKSRRVNDYHHAKDAYLNIVVGNVYDARFTSNPVQWIRQNRYTNYSISKVFNYDVYRGKNLVWKGPDRVDNRIVPGTGTLARIRATMARNDILYTEYSYCETGELFDAMPVSKKRKTRIPLKAGLDPEKYGGYSGAKTSYFALVEFDGKKGKRTRQLIGVPIYITNQLEHNPHAFVDYCRANGLENPVILREQIKKNALIIVDGFPMRIRGENDKNNMFKGNMQLRLDESSEKTIRAIEKYLEKSENGTKYEISEHHDQINHEKVNQLYDVLIGKMELVYGKRPSMKKQLATLKSSRDTTHNSEDLLEKIKLINEMLTLVRCDIITSANLLFIGGSKMGGKMDVNKTTVGESELILVNQSVTGLFENRVKL